MSSPADKIKSYAYLKALSSCASNGDFVSSITGTPSFNGIVTKDDQKNVSLLVDSGSGSEKCSKIATDAFDFWGYSKQNAGDFLQAIGYKKSATKLYTCRVATNVHVNKAPAGTDLLDSSGNIVIDDGQFISIDGSNNNTPVIQGDVSKFTWPVSDGKYTNGYQMFGSYSNINDTCMYGIRTGGKYNDGTEIAVHSPSASSNIVYKYSGPYKDSSGNYYKEIDGSATYTSPDSKTLASNLEKKIATDIYGGGSTKLSDTPGLEYYLYYHYLFDSGVCKADQDTEEQYNASTTLSYNPNKKEVTIINKDATDSSNAWAIWGPDRANNRTADNTTYPLFADSGSSYQNVNLKCSDVADRFAGLGNDIKKDIANRDNKKYGSIFASTTTNDDSTKATGAAATSCNINGIGWLVCPVVRFMSQLADGLYNILVNNFLTTSPTIFSTGDQGVKSTYNAWNAMRNIANVAFVIGFLVVIFSQLTGAGVTNYGIKKMLPRLIIAVILVNLSYYICQIAVDISNILGSSLRGFITGLAINTDANTVNGVFGGSFDSVASKILSGVGTIAVVAGAAVFGYASLATLIPALIAAVVGFVMILFLLIGRQVLIILLIVLSPLAFVAFLLPNTEKLFKTWQKTLTAMLLLFPIVSIVYGASFLAANILSGVFSAKGGNEEWLGQIATELIRVLPLFVVPSLLKNSLNSIGKIGAKISGFGGKISGGINSKTKEPLQNWQTQRENKAMNSTTAFNPYRQYNRWKTRRTAIGQNQKSDLQRAQTEYITTAVTNDKSGKGILRQMTQGGNQESLARARARAFTAADKQEEEQVANAVTLLYVDTKPGDRVLKAGESLAAAVSANGGKGDRIKARAALKVLYSSGGAGIDKAHNTIMSIEDSGPVNDVLRNSLRSDTDRVGLKAKDATLAAWAHDAGNLKVSEIERLGSTFKSLSPVELAGQSDSKLAEIIDVPGAVTPEQALAALNNQNAAQNLNAEKIRLLGLKAAEYQPPINPNNTNPQAPNR
jgi:ribosomal protein L17